MGKDELATQIVIAMIQNEAFKVGPLADKSGTFIGYTNQVCAAYRTIYKTLLHPDEEHFIEAKSNN